MSQEFVISTTALTRRFGDVTAVRDLDLQVPHGSVYGFLGPNGAGKTTTIRMLLGLIRPDAGGVCLFGAPLRERRLALLRRIGALVETPSLYPHLTGRENLELTRRLLQAEHGRIERALRIVHLEEAAGRRVGTYSSGMRQRLALALALLNGPELLILDEPTNGLDPAGIQEIRELLCRLARGEGTTVFLSSHLLSEVEQVATHIAIIQKGRLRFQGTLDELHSQVQHQVILGIEQPREATQLLRQAGWQVRGNGNHRLVVTANDRADAAMINRQLVQGGIHVYELKLERPSLEEIFIALTEESTRRSV